MTFQEAQQRFAKARNKDRGAVLPGRLGQTRLVKTDNGFGVKYVNTVVVEILPGDKYVLNTGGWYTKTTKERIQEYAPINLMSSKGLWFVGSYSTPKPKGIGYHNWLLQNHPQFNDGMVVDAEGTVVKASKALARQQNAAEALAERYAKGFADKIIAKEIGLPGGGDCWGCVMKTTDGKVLGDVSMHDHVLSHVEESYYVPALLWNALIESGHRPEVWFPRAENTFVDLGHAMAKRIIKKYVLRRLRRLDGTALLDVQRKLKAGAK